MIHKLVSYWRIVLLTICFGFFPSLAVLTASPPDTVTIETKKEQILFKIGSHTMACYHIAPSVAKPYLWPVRGPGGVAMTRAWPMEKPSAGDSTDHIHQKSIWFSHGDVIPEGLDLKHRLKDVQGVDFWSEAPGHGRIVCVQVGKPELTPQHAQISTRNEWRTADGKKILDETRILHCYALEKAQLYVFDIDLHASMAPIVFGDTKEGAMAVRVHDRLRATNGTGTIENAAGKQGELRCWGRTSPWCDYSGVIEKETVGITLFDAPTNRYPACWHVRGYGLMAANPFGRIKAGFPAMRRQKDLVRLDKGEHLKLRYGILIHAGNAKRGQVAKYYQHFRQLKFKE